MMILRRLPAIKRSPESMPSNTYFIETIMFLLSALLVSQIALAAPAPLPQQGPLGQFITNIGEGVNNVLQQTVIGITKPLAAVSDGIGNVAAGVGDLLVNRVVGGALDILTGDDGSDDDDTEGGDDSFPAQTLPATVDDPLLDDLPFDPLDFLNNPNNDAAMSKPTINQIKTQTKPALLEPSMNDDPGFSRPTVHQNNAVPLVEKVDSRNSEVVNQLLGLPNSPKAPEAPAVEDVLPFAAPPAQAPAPTTKIIVQNVPSVPSAPKAETMNAQAAPQSPVSSQPVSNTKAPATVIKASQPVSKHGSYSAKPAIQQQQAIPPVVTQVEAEKMPEPIQDLGLSSSSSVSAAPSATVDTSSAPVEAAALSVPQAPSGNGYEKMEPIVSSANSASIGLFVFSIVTLIC